MPAKESHKNSCLFIGINSKGGGNTSQWEFITLGHASKQVWSLKLHCVVCEISDIKCKKHGQEKKHDKRM